MPLGDLLSFAGGLIGPAAQARQSRSNRKLTREQMQMQRSQFAAQMDQSIQRRVSDAQKAGIHPLFALGASVGASPTASIGGGETGEAPGGALGRSLQGIGGRIAQAEIQSKSSSAKRDEAEAAYHNARTKLLEQKFASQGRDGASVPADPVVAEADTGVVMGPAQYVKPQVAASQSRGLAAGTHPLFVETVHPNGRKTQVLNPDLNLDDISNPSTVAVLRNMWIDWSSAQIEKALKQFQFPYEFERRMQQMARRKRQEKRKPPGTRQNFTDWISP